jgi:opacity protein-like surface antigen
MKSAVRAVLSLALLLVLSGVGSPARAQATPWSVSPSVGIAFHGDYYDDQVVTTFAGSDRIEADVTEIDPGASLRLGGRVGYGFVRGVRFHGGIFTSWPDAEVAVGTGADRTVQSDVGVRVLEFTGGATVDLGELTASRVPVYVGGSVGLVNHAFDEVQWEEEFVDPSTTALRFGARAGVSYPVTPRVSLRAELRQTTVWGAYGDFEDEIAAVESRQEGLEGDTDFEGNSYSIFGLDAGLTLRL